MRTLFLLFLIACTSNKKMIKKHVVEGSCESKIQTVQLPKGQEILSNIKEVAGKGTSYMVTGLAYSTDVILSFTGGILGGAVVCSPLLAFDAMASSSTISGDCIGSVGGEIMDATNPHLGPKVSQGTKSWRCPDMDPIAEGLIRVSECYKEKGETELAKLQLKRMVESKGFHSCLSKKMRTKIQKSLPHEV